MRFSHVHKDTIRLNRAAPAAPVVASPLNPLITANPAVQAAAEANSVITLVYGGVVLATSQGRGDSAVEIKLDALPEGVHQLLVYATDEAGNRSTETTVAQITVDRTPPSAPVIVEFIN